MTRYLHPGARWPALAHKDSKGFVMIAIRRSSVPILLASILLLLLACGDSEMSADPVATAEPADVTDPAQAESASDASAAEKDAEVIDPNSLSEAGQIELKQYSVAYIGSGSMGGGTLTVDGKSRPFKIAGLGIGGIGAAAIDATGTVYNLPSLDAFAGTYGNARLGMTAGDSGKGRLWLKNPNGVVIELRTQMRGLALTSGLDGILIKWDDGNDTVVDGSGEVVGGAIEVGADSVQGAADVVKKPFQ